jgi:anti-sigma B factor antagonist
VLLVLLVGVVVGRVVDGKPDQFRLTGRDTGRPRVPYVVWWRVVAQPPGYPRKRGYGEGVTVTAGSSDIRRAPFSVTVARPERASVVVTVAGEIDLVTSEDLKAAFGQALEPLPPGLLIDLREVEFCDSTGLATLIGLNSRSIADEVDLKVRPSPMILRLAQRTGLSTFLPFAGS